MIRLLVVLLLCTQAFGETYYVDPVAGNDANDGSNVEEAFLTVEFARSTINGSTGNTIILEDGDYYFTATLDLTATDSGGSGAVNLYQAQTGATPVWHGSSTLAGDSFTADTGSIVKGDYSSPNPTDLVVTVNGDRYLSAREPDHDYSNDRAGWLFTSNVQDDTKSYLEYQSGSFDPSGWTGVSGMSVNPHPGSNYKNQPRGISSITTGNLRITLDSNVGSSFNPDDHFYIYDGYSLLDVAKEFWYNDTTDFLYIIPEVAFDADDVINISKIDRVVDLQAVDYVTFDGITFTESYDEGVRMDDCTNIIFTGCTVKNVGGTGIYLEDSTNITVTGSTILEAGADGIKSRASSGNTRLKLLTVSNNAFTSNTISQVHWVANGAGGAIYLDGEVGALVNKNVIHTIPSIAIRYDGNDNIIEKNWLYNVIRYCQDNGAIYAGGRSWLRRGNKIRYNVIDANNAGWGSNNGTTEVGYLGYGVYLDDLQSGDEIYENIIRYARYGNFFIHGGRDNNFHHNILIANDNSEEMIRASLGINSSLGVMWTEWDSMQAGTDGYTKSTFSVPYPEVDDIVNTELNVDLIENNDYRANVFILPGQIIEIIDAKDKTSDTQKSTWENNFWYPNTQALGWRLNSTNYNLTTWQALGHGHDVNSVSLDGIIEIGYEGMFQTIWNDTDSTVVYDLNDVTYADVNDAVVTSLSLGAYKSTILFAQTPTPAPVTWLTGYSHRKKFSAQAANIDSSLSNAILYLEITGDTDIGGNMVDDSTYKDYRITDADSVVLPYKHASFVITTGSATAEIWVKHTLDAAGTDMYIYYGKTSDTDGQGDPWSGYLGAWHMDETTGLMLDESTSANDGTFNGSLPTAIAGVAGNGQDFDGLDDYVEWLDPNDDVFNFPDAYTVSVWVFSQDATADRVVLNKRDASTDYLSIVQQDSPDKWEWRMTVSSTVKEVDSDSAASTDQWVHWVVTVTAAGLMTGYIDGVAQADTETQNAALSVTGLMRMGTDQAGAKDFDGYMDELIIDDSAWSAALVKWHEANLSETDNEITISAQEAGATSTTTPRAIVIISN